MALLAFANVALGQAEGLSFSDTRITYGVLGPVRASHKLLPGDSLFVDFDIKGLSVDKDNRVRYTTTTEICDSTGKTCFKQPSQELTVVNALGGNSFPAFARVDLGLDQTPGEYALTVTVTDLANKKSKSLTEKFTVLPKAFGIVGLTVTGDQEGNTPTGLMSVGQNVWLHAAVVGFQRDEKGQPNVDLEVRILDEKGKLTTAKPFTGNINKEVRAKANALPLQFLLALNRAGKFTIEVKAMDKPSRKTFGNTFSINVLANR
jgi:hypothetical protein